MILAAIGLAMQPAPAMTDPFEQALGVWARCARYQIDIGAAGSNRRNMAAVDEAMTRCTAEEAAVRSLLRERSGAEQGDRAMAEAVSAMRNALLRYLRRLHRR